VCVNLGSGTEQAGLKSSTLQNKDQDKKVPVPVMLNPGVILSPCPGLSITPVVNCQTNDLSRNIPMKSKNYNFEQLGNCITITKTDKKPDCV